MNEKTEEPVVAVVVGEQSVKKKCMTVRKTIKKDGTVSVREYDQSEYNRICYEKNKATYSVVIDCGCGKHYTKYTKHNHFKSALHQLYERMNVVPIEPVIEPVIVPIVSIMYNEPVIVPIVKSKYPLLVKGTV
jgi:hypothetical protein